MQCCRQWLPFILFIISHILILGWWKYLKLEHLCIITPFKFVYPPANFNILLSITFCLVSSFNLYLPFSLKLSSSHSEGVRKCLVSCWEEDVGLVCFAVTTFLTYYMCICPVLTDLTSDHTAKYKHIIRKVEPRG